MSQSPKENIVYTCCGKRWSHLAAHYDKFSHPGCSKVWIALQPKRFGPFEAFPWAGDAAMAAYEKRCADEAAQLQPL